MNKALVFRLMIVAVSLLVIGSVVGRRLYREGTRQPAEVDASPLAGSSSIDFGTVRFSGTEETVNHVFRLTNASDELVSILDVVSSCGCSTAEPSRTDINPGESVDVVASLKLQGGGERNATIWLKLKGGRTHTLALTAQGLRLNGAQLSHLVVDMGGVEEEEQGINVSAEILATAYTQPGERPPHPSVNSPAGIQVDVGEWVALPIGNDVFSRWAALIVVKRNDLPLDGDFIEVFLDGESIGSIRLDGRPM
ncbi:MAG: DUF1573 domain-containing protein [Planctomycetota bacterium]|nr:DUF1573 domain-containing protein [Planctomycetota bacterium]